MSHLSSAEQQPDIEELKSQIEHLNQELITARNKLATQEQLIKQFRLTQFVLDHSKDTAFWIQPDGRLRYVNRVACETLGYSRDELLSMSLHDLDTHYPKEIWSEFLRNVKKSGNSSTESIFSSGNGGYVPIEIAGNFIEFEGEELYCIFARNIADRKMTENTLREAEVKYSDIFQGAAEGILYADKKARIIEVNPALTEMTGLQREELIGKSGFAVARKLVSRKDIRRILKIIVQNITGIGTNRLELEFRGKTLEISTRTRKDKFGIIAMIRDVTEHRRFENQVRIQKELAIRLSEMTSRNEAFECSLKAAIDVSGMDCGGVYLINETTGDLELHYHTGFDRDFIQSAGRFDKNLPHSERLSKGFSVHTVVSEKHLESYNERKPEGLKAISFVPLVSGGQVIGCINVASRNLDKISDVNRDALEAMCGQIGAAISRIKASEALQKNEATLKSFFLSAPTGIALTINRVLKDVNAKFCEMVGYSKDELLDKEARMLYEDQETYEKVSIKYDMIRQFGIGNVETRWRRKDGTIIDVLLSAAPVAPDDLSQGVTSTCLDMTDRKQNEQALRESESRYIDLYNNAPDMFVSVDALTENIIRCNKTFLKKTGFREDEVIGMNVYTFYHPDCITAARAAFDSFGKTGFINDEELQICRKDGTVIDVSLSVSAVRDSRGKIATSRSVLRDVTDRKRLEDFNRVQRELAIKLGEFLRLDEALNYCLTAAIESSGMDSGGIYILDEETGDLLLSSVTGFGTDFIKSALRYKSDSKNSCFIANGKPIYTVYSEFTSVKTKEMTGEGLRGLAVIPLIFEGQVIGCMNLASHTQDTISEHARIVIESIAGQVGSAIARMQAIEELRTSEEKYRIVVESSGLPIIYFDVAGVVKVINSIAANGLGGKPEDFIGRSTFEIFPEMADSLKEGITGVIKKGVGIELEERIELPIGNRWLIHNAQPVKDARGRTIGILDVAHDLTERKLAEEALQKSEERYRRLFEDDLTGDYISTPGGKIVTCNPAFMRIFGFDSIEETLSASMKSLYKQSSDRERFLKDLTTAGKLEFYERELRQKNGKVLHVIENSVGIFNEDGKLKLIRGYVIDNTERKKLEEQLHHSQKMESIGRLAGGIAHDFNNLLTVIAGNTDMALSTLNPNDPLRNDLAEIQTAADHAADLTRQLLAFSRKQALQPKILIINQVIRNIDRMLRRIIGENIGLNTMLSQRSWRVSVDPGQIEQVIVNLAVNARDAMPGGGVLTIETQNISIDNNNTENHLDIKPGKYVMLAISDTGSGIPDDIRDNIFDPFFTTKGLAEGTGLGLSTVYGIIKQSNGYIWVYSEPEKGTTFKIYLPRVNGEVSKMEGSESEPGIPAGKGTVLVVEDEEGVRNLTCKVLKRQGYRVVSAASGGEAIQLCRKMEKSIDLVIADVVMPVMSGIELVAELKEIYPAIKMLYISGYTANAMVQDEILGKGHPYLQKPFLPQTLAKKMSEILDRN